MFKTGVINKITELEVEAENLIQNLYDTQMHFISRTVGKLNNIVSYSVYSVPSIIMAPFIGAFGKFTESINASINAINNVIDNVDSIFTTFAAATALAVGVSNFNAIFNNVVSQVSAGIVNNVMSWPNEWIRVESYPDPISRASSDGWECFFDLGMCQREIRPGVKETASIEEIMLRYGGSV
ncbi:MAG: hypothetical protein QXD03_03785 [Candidatus Anstonellales archaeon]